MNNIYFFKKENGKLSAYPHDQTYEYFNYAMTKAKNNVQIVLVRKDNLLHYCYIRKIDNRNLFGICFQTDRIYIDTSILFKKFDDIIIELAKNGILLKIDNNGNLAIIEGKFSDESVAIKEISEKFIKNLSLSTKTTLPLPPPDFSVSINDCFDLAIEDCTGVEIINAIKRYCNVYIATTHAEIARVSEMQSIIKTKNTEIEKLNSDIAELQANISKLKRQKKQVRGILLMLIFIIVGIIVFIIYAQNKTSIIENNITTISNLNDTIITRNQTIIAMKKTINDKETQLSLTTNKLNHLYRALTDTIHKYEYFPGWKSTNHNANSTSSKQYKFFGYKGDILHIPYYVSSESCCDKLIITLSQNGKEEQILSIGGEYPKSSNYYNEYTIVDNGMCNLTVMYKKDQSVDKGYDYAGVKDFYVSHSTIYNRLKQSALYKQSELTIMLPKNVRTNNHKNSYTQPTEHSHIQPVDDY